MVSARAVQLMLVEANRHVCEQISTLLAGEPTFRLATMVDSGVQAVTEARWLAPDMIVMDVRLPDGSGLTVTRIIKQLVPKCHVILLIGGAEQREPAMSAGASETILKSALEGTLMQTLRCVISPMESKLPPSSKPRPCQSGRQGRGDQMQDRK